MNKIVLAVILSCNIFLMVSMESPVSLDKKFAEAVLNGKLDYARAYLHEGANSAYDPNLLCKLLHKIFVRPLATDEQRNLKDELLKLLIFEHATVLNCQDADGVTPLMILVRQNELELVELMLSSERVNLDVENNQGITALDMAKSKEMRKLLMDAGVPAGSGKRKIAKKSSPAKSPAPSPKKSPIKWEAPKLVPQHKSAKQEFFEAVSHGDVARVVDMVKGGYPSYINDLVDHVTPLMIAIQKQSLPLVELLLKAPLLDLAKENISGNTALILAVLHDNPQIVKALLQDKRSEINHLNKFAYTALDFVKDTLNGNAIKVLLMKHGAKKGNEVYKNTAKLRVE